MPTTHPGSQEVDITEAEWTLLMQITKENLNDIDCIMVQMTEAKLGKKSRGTLQHAAEIEEERRGYKNKEEKNFSIFF